MAPVHAEAPPLSAHEAHSGVRQPKEWRQPGQKAVKKAKTTFRCPAV